MAFTLDSILIRLAELKIDMWLRGGEICLAARADPIPEKCFKVIEEMKPVIIEYLKSLEGKHIPDLCVACGEKMEGSVREFEYWPLDRSGKYTNGPDYVRVVSVCSECKVPEPYAPDPTLMDKYRDRIRAAVAKKEKVLIGDGRQDEPLANFAWVAYGIREAKETRSQSRLESVMETMRSALTPLPKSSLRSIAVQRPAFTQMSLF